MTEDTQGNSMQKPRVFFDVNLGTLLPIALAFIAGFSYIKGLETQITVIDNRGQNRIQIADKFYADVTAQLKLNETSPMRLTTVEEGLRSTNARIERVVDLIQTGQESVRRDMQTGFDLIRKDVSTLGTKVEVLGSKLEDGQSRMDRTRFNMPILKR
jgi:hypothetical protein